MSARPSRTEAELLGLLRERYTEKAGNGDAWAFIPKVRNAAGFDASRTCDALAMSLWPSRGLALHGFEVKSDRSDWLRELKNPAKAEAFAGHCDYWWIVAGDKEIVRAGELPPTWGLLHPHGGRLRVTVDAPPLRPRDPDRPLTLPPGFNRSFVAALLRSACQVAAVTPEQIVEAREQVREDEERRWEQRVKLALERAERAEEVIRRFEQEGGVHLSQWSWRAKDSTGEIAKALRSVLDGDHDAKALENRIRGLARTAEELAGAAREAVAKHGRPAPAPVEEQVF